MEKIITLFQRNYETDRLVRDEVVPGAEWVLNGEGVATRKWDGTCCMIDEQGQFFKRYELKNGKTAPADFVPAQDQADPVTGDLPGWVLVKKEDRWHLEAYRDLAKADKQAGEYTYELCGPRINGNPERLEQHVLIRHGWEKLLANPRSFAELKEYLSLANIEGIVWWHPDDRKVKLKKRDFGFRR